MTNSYIQAVAERCAKAIGLEFVPRFFRWNSRRGYAHTTDRKFSLPKWLQERSQTLQLAYIAHEVAHMHPDSISHGTKFRENEMKACAAYFIVPKYANDIVYAVQFCDTFTNEVLCDRNGYESTHPNFMKFAYEK